MDLLFKSLDGKWKSRNSFQGFSRSNCNHFTGDCILSSAVSQFYTALNMTVRIFKSTLETVQDFLIKLGIKPLMHLLEISIFSLNNDLVRLTKIMNNLVKDLKILSFKVIFQCLKLVESFQKKKSLKNIWLGDLITLPNFFENFDF